MVQELVLGEAVSGEDASASLLGYLYQIDAALVLFVEEPQSDADPALAVELFDDFSLTVGQEARTLAQVKFKVKSDLRAFSDSSRDVWRTLELWIRAFDPNRPVRRIMVTNATAKADSAMSYLRPRGRNVRTAAARLTRAAQVGTNQNLKSAYKAWKQLSQNDKLALLETITLIEHAGDFETLHSRLDRALSWSAPPHAPEAFRKQVLARWRDIALGILLRRRGPLPQSELRSLISDVRDGFSYRNLPTTVSEGEVRSQADLGRLIESELYVDQMRWIKSPPTLFEQAVVDYCRAVRQKADWLEDNILSYFDIEDYERRLIIEWKELRDWLLVDLNDSSDGRAKVDAGRQLYKKLMLEMQSHVRDSYLEPFFMRGTYHSLANREVDGLGWHPDFLALIDDRSAAVVPVPVSTGV